MQIFNTLQLKGGARTEYSKLGAFTQPKQFIPNKEKDEAWAAHNLDFLETQGIRQVRVNGRRFIKNIRLAYGIIDKSDYIVEEENELSDLVATLTKEDQSALDIKFFPIIPNVIKVLEGEFSKRNNKLMFRAVDELSHNEMLEQKRQMIEDSLIKDAEQKMVQQMIQQGMDPNSEEAQQALAPENIKSLPQIEDFFKKNYRSVIEEWGQHQYVVDTERFNMKEMEQRQFKRMLILNREFWHFRMNEDDYDIEEWDPVFTFFHKSPSVNYISQGNYVGKVDLLTVSDVIDKYGYLMSDKQLRSLEDLYAARAMGYAVSGTPNDGSFYDGSKSYEWNTQGPSLGMRQMASMYDGWVGNGDIVSWLMKDTEDSFHGVNELIRVSTIYWKSQRKLYHLTKINEQGETIQEIVDESYPVTDKPLYDTTYYKTKTKENVIFGEHLDPIWINEVWGGVKIGANKPATWNSTPGTEGDTIYLGINKPKPGRLPFQFKGDHSVYGCKLPVEGCVFTDRNVRSVSLVDSMKPAQVGFNLVNNQIADILVDELGTVIVIDQNTIPQQSMGESWGRNNMAKAFVAMKNFQMLPIDTTLSNTESATQFNQFTKLDMEQSGRLMSRIELARYFKESAYEVVGITPQRMGQVMASESATGVQQSTNGSFAQTEGLFIQHSDWLMKRVHQMRTDLAQYYNCTKPSLRLQYITSTDERVNFEMNGTDLMARDLNIFVTMDAGSREYLFQMKQLAMSNGQANGTASIHDLGNILKSESIAELDRVLKAAEEKQQAQIQAQQQHEKELEDQRIAAAQQQLEEANAREDKREQDRNQTAVLVAEIKASGYPDTSEDGQDEYMKRLQFIQGQDQFQQTMDVKRTSETNKTQLAREQLAQGDRKIAADRDKAAKALQVARVNKNKFDKPTPKKK